MKHELAGQRFGRITVIKLQGLDKHKSRLWECKCDCGKTSYVRSSDLINGKVVSCGCYSRDIARERATKHSLSESRIYFTYNNMIARCYRKNAKHYSNYGERGIEICDEWRNSFEAFAKWAYESGYKDDLTIERKDVNKGYEPDNCTWIPHKEQAVNRTTTHWVTYHGETMPLSYLAQKVGVSTKAIRVRENRFKNDYESIIDNILSSKYRRIRKGK